jgi:branched-chain amino acid transport system ATP-binding protein
MVVQELGRQIRKLKDMGLTILLAEQNIEFATRIADRAYIIETGRIRFEGTIEDLARQQDVKEKYLMI